MGWLRRLLESGRPRKSEDTSTQAAARPAVWADVFDLANLLERHKVEYVLVGGYALNFNGLVRQTGDVDILVKNTVDNNRKWVAALSQLPDRAAAVLVGQEDTVFQAEDEEEKDLLDEEPGVLRIVDEFVVDVMPKTCGLTYEQLLPHIRKVSTSEGSISVLDLDGLLKTKQGIRPKDVNDRHFIMVTLERIGGRSADHVEDMGRRDFLSDDPLPPAGVFELREPKSDADPEERADYTGPSPR